MDNMFGINYNDKLDKLELQKEKKVKHIFNFVQNHKFFSIILISFFALSGINFYLIYSFIKILENV